VLNDLRLSVEECYFTEWLRDGSGKPGAIVREANESEDLKRTARNADEHLLLADSQKKFSFWLIVDSA
jgi:hypothetical protein